MCTNMIWVYNWLNASTFPRFVIIIVFYTECKTVNGEKCIFPFQAHGDNHTRCFQINHQGDYKCATEAKAGVDVPDDKLGVCNMFCDPEGNIKL